MCHIILYIMSELKGLKELGLSLSQRGKNKRFLVLFQPSLTKFKADYDRNTM